MRKALIIPFLLLFLVLLGGVNAVDNSLGTYKKDNCITITQLCSNCTYNNISNVFYPNSSIASGTSNIAMTRIGTFYNSTFCNTNLTGVYIVNGFGNPNGLTEVWDSNFIITKTGESLSGDNFRIVIWTLFIVATIGLFYTFFVTMAKLALTEETIYDVLVSWVFFILMIITNHLSADMIDDFIFNISSNFITIGGFSNVFLPLLTFIITFWVQSTQKKSLLDVKRLGGFRR